MLSHDYSIENVDLVQSSIDDYLEHIGTPSVVDLKVWSRLLKQAIQKEAQEPPRRGVWVEFAENGRIVDTLREAKDAKVPDSFVWCEESR